MKKIRYISIEYIVSETIEVEEKEFENIMKKTKDELYDYVWGECVKFENFTTELSDARIEEVGVEDGN